MPIPEYKGDPGINPGRHNTKKPGATRVPGFVSEEESVTSRLNWILRRRAAQDDNCVWRPRNKCGVTSLMDSEFHGLLLGAALDDGKVHAGCKRSVLAKFCEAFAVTALRSDELSVDTDEMDNVIV